MIDYFKDEEVYDPYIYMRNVPDIPDHYALTKPLMCGDGWIPVDFTWNGSGSGGGWFGWLQRKAFPKWKHPIASCRHDWRCSLLETEEQRDITDTLFRRDVARTGTRLEAQIGYIGVRIGAIFNIGSNATLKGDE